MLFETIETDLAALQAEIDLVEPDVAGQRNKQQPKRAALPAKLPRKEIVHEPASAICSCGCQLQRIGEDIAAHISSTTPTDLPLR